MKLSVPFNGQPDLLEKIDKRKITEIYGKLTQDFVGGGRPSWTTPNVSKRKIASCVKEAHKFGIEFNYLLNASCLGNKEWTRSGQRRLGSLLDWLAQIGVDTVTVTIPYLAEIIRKRYPFKITASSIGHINTVRRAKMWEEMGVDEIAISQMDLVRNFPLIRQIRKNIKCKTKMVANEDCFIHCHDVFYHGNLCAHGSQHTLGGYFLDYCRIACRLKRIAEPVNFIRAVWIRPEDSRHYEEAGIDHLKITDRAMTTEALVRIVKAYTDCRYDGNLLDLLPHPSMNLVSANPDWINKIRYFFRPFHVNIFKLYAMKSIMTDFDVYIDNRSLDGFIEFFLKENCESRPCRECGYCERVAGKVIKINPASQANMRQTHINLLDKMISGEIFKY